MKGGILVIIHNDAKVSKTQIIKKGSISIKLPFLLIKAV
jgi:hypothetical protein